MEKGFVWRGPHLWVHSLARGIAIRAAVTRVVGLSEEGVPGRHRGWDR